MKKTRRILQFAFLALTLGAVFLVQGNAERWCPFGGVETLYTYFAEGNLICSLGVANFFILAAVLVSALLVRRAFCGYMCPVGTISEWLYAAGQRLGLRGFGVPQRWDRGLRLLKYVMLGVILFFTWRAGELVFRGFDPCYALISRHGPDITLWAYVAAAAVVAASLLVVMPFCRWLCPLAAVLNPFSRFAVARIKRDPAGCGYCGRCSQACPMAIPVDQLQEVTSARCISCMNCAEACPKRHSGTIRWGPPELLARRWPQAVLVAVLLSCTGAAVAASYLFPMASFIASRGTPPERAAAAELLIENLTCRGRGNMLLSYLQRDDVYAIAGYFKVEAWPGPGLARVRISYDPAKTDQQAIKKAITEWCYDQRTNQWSMPPFRIEGYDPLALPVPCAGNGLSTRP